MSRGIAFFNDASYDQALEEFELSISNSSENEDAYFFLGLTHEKKGEHALAISAFEEALRINPGMEGVHLNLGIARFNTGTYDQALQEFAAAEKTDPTNSSVPFFTGLIYRKKNLHTESIPFFQRAMEMDPDIEALARFNIGLAYFETGDRELAETEFNKVIEVSIDSDLISSSQELLNTLNTGNKKKWWMRASSHVMFDDNVAVVEQDQITNKEDTAYVLEFGSGYNLSTDPAFGMYVGYDLYQSFFHEQNDLDFQSHSFSLGSSHETELWDTRLDYSFVHTTLGQEDFLNMHNIIPRFGFSIGQASYTSLNYMLQDKDFASLDSRDAVNHSGAVNQYFFFLENTAYANLGYRYDDEDTRDNTFDYRGHLISFGLNFQLPWESKLFSSYQYNLKLFKNLTAEIERDRRDERQTVKMIFTKKLIEHLDFKVDYEHIMSTSNLESVDYTENILMFGIAFSM